MNHDQSSDVPHFNFITLCISKMTLLVKWSMYVDYKYTFVNSVKKTTAAELNGILPFTLQMFSRTTCDPYRNALIKIVRYI
jgi:hypothetical protein